MKSVVDVAIDRPHKKIAELFADPGNNPKWMHDLARYEPISGDQGMKGSTYRLVAKEGGRMFIATVVERKLPDELCLNLEASTVDVAIKVTFIPLSSTRTRLISEEVFTFKDSNSAAVDPAVQDAIKAAHRRHINDFASFAEQDLSASVF